MRDARSRRLSMSIAATCFLVMSGAGKVAVAKEPACPESGTTYRPNPEDRDKHSFYRLRIDSSPVADDPLQRSEIWRFQMFDHDTRKKLSELRLLEYCPTGGPCVIALDGRQGTDIYSDVIRLTKEFRQPTNYFLMAPQAIILSGFRRREWMFDNDEKEHGYLTYSGKPRLPQMKSYVIWTRVSCDRR